MRSIGVVIVNYHSAVRVRACIDSLKKHVRSVPFAIVVVDNSEATQERDILEAHSDVICFHTGRNLGFAGGCNLGIRCCLDRGCEYIQLLNPDTRVEHDFLSPLLDAMEQDRSIGAAGPKIVSDNSLKTVWYGGAELNWWMGGPKQIFDNRNDALGNVQTVPCLSGCAMLLRREAVRAIGMIDERYFLYFEDTDYCLRLSSAGWRLAYVPQAEVLHAASSVVGFQSEKYVYYFSRNRLLLMRRWASSLQFAVYMLFNVVVKLPGAVIMFGLLRGRPGLAAAYLKGGWDGVRFRMVKR